MRLEFIILFAVALVGLIGLMQLNSTGMVVKEPTLAHYPSFFGTDFDAVIIKGKMRSPEEINAVNLVIDRLPQQYSLLRQAMYAKGVAVPVLTSDELQRKIFVEDQIDYMQTDAVLVGSLCHNSAIAHLLGVIDCVHYFKPGEGIVKLIDSGGHRYLIITGYSGDEVLAATIFFLSELQLDKLDSKELKIDSTMHVPLRDPAWYGEYTTTPSYRDTMKYKVFVLGQWMDLR